MPDQAWYDGGNIDNDRGARGGTRTHMPEALVFKTSVYTSSTTRAFKTHVHPHAYR